MITVVTLVATQFHSSNFSAGDGFAPAGVKGILSAIATGGVVFAYPGFEQTIQFGGETRDPKRNIPLPSSARCRSAPSSTSSSRSPSWER